MPAGAVHARRLRSEGVGAGMRMLPAGCVGRNASRQAFLVKSPRGASAETRIRAHTEPTKALVAAKRIHFPPGVGCRAGSRTAGLLFCKGIWRTKTNQRSWH
jgi:hypothetical protein